MARDVHMRSADLVTRRQVRQRQRHLRIVRHELQHAGIKTAQRVAEEIAQVGGTPSLRGRRREREGG